MERTYIAIDLKSFYASVECVERHLDPLTTNLVVADASRTEKTICLAVTPSLKAYGLSGRSRLFEVVQKVEEIRKRTGKVVNYITATPRMALYIEYSAKIYGIYLNYFSEEDIHVYSIDEVFIDATSYLPLYKMKAHDLARKVISDILAQTGITATAGIGENLYLAKIAMDIVAKHIPADKDGVRIAELSQRTFRETLWTHKPLTDFWRTGYGTEKRLKDLGLFTMGDVARKSLTNPEILYKTFGIDAELLIDHAWGYENCTMKDIKAYRSKTKNLGQGQVLTCPYTKQKARIVTKEMAESLALDLVEKKLASASFTLYVSYDSTSLTPDFTGDIQVDYYGRPAPRSAHGTIKLGSETASASKITAGVLSLFDSIVDDSLLVRRINLNANGVIHQENEQFDFFNDESALAKERSLQNTMLDIQKKFGKNALLRGSDFEDGATLRERNLQIGGHRA